MKKFSVLLLVFLCLGFAAGAQTISYKSPATLLWDPPPPVVGVLTYQITRAPSPVADRVNPSVIAEVAATTIDVTTPRDGKEYAYAVRSKLVTDGGATTLFSSWLWSDTGGTPPFLVKAPSVDAPGSPGGFRIQ